MTSITITYYLNQETPSLLGTEISTGIEQILCPSNIGKHAITITKFFSSQSVHRWEVIKINHLSNDKVDIYLSPREYTVREVFLSKTYKSNNSITRKMQKGTLVEVEYGYVQQVKKSSGDLRTNKRYPDMVHHGEMHKRRLAIVIGIKGNLVRIVPISSEKQKAQDNSVFTISHESLKELTHYNDKNITSSAISSSIQTVAFSRILPPLSLQGNNPSSYRDTKYPHKLVIDDIKLLEKSLSATVGCADYQETKNERNKLRLDCKKQTDEIIALTEETERLKGIDDKFTLLMEIMIDWKRGLKDISLECAEQEINADIEQYRELLSQK